VKKTFIKGIGLNDTNVRLNILAIHFSQIAKANGFCQPNVQNFPNFFIVLHCPFRNAFFERKIK
jgi:hypothetical protein